MNFERENLLISTDPGLLDIDFVCRSLNSTYWAGNRPRPVIEESIRNSVCFGVYEKEGRKQIGFARVVTDKATFSWICDVFIAEDRRGKGLGKWLMACVTGHPFVKQSLSMLGTRDAHGLYEKYGYVRTKAMRRRSQELEPVQTSQPTTTAVEPPCGPGGAPAASRGGPEPFDAAR
jgi:GNAT superfamily N-acetyltransferase